MTLTVPFDEFPLAMRKVIGHKQVFVSGGGREVTVSAMCVDKNVGLVSRTEGAVDEVMAKLREAHLEPSHGFWDCASADGGPGADVFVAAVAYAAEHRKPGLWVDVYPTRPSQTQVLRALFEEFDANGEIEHLDFEEFVRLADANVVILGPAELQRYAGDKRPAEVAGPN